MFSSRDAFENDFCPVRDELLGELYRASEHGLPKLVESVSNERQVSPETPPTFLFHTSEDTGVPPENSVLFYMALRKAKVPAEMHIYEKGPHGVGLAAKDPILSTWSALCAGWLKSRGITGDK